MTTEPSQPVTPAKADRTLVIISTTLRDKLKMVAVTMRTSIYSLVDTAVTQYLDNLDKEE